MDLKQLPDDMKIKTFNLIIDKYNKDSSISEFGHDVEDILKMLKELYK